MKSNNEKAVALFRFCDRTVMVPAPLMSYVSCV
jgi:hypothetical protein